MRGSIKCLVWDLDNTLWSGTLLESGPCRLRPGVRRVLGALDRRGILLSIASLNDPDQALPLLHRKRLDRLFLHAQIGWSNKVHGLRAISSRLGITLDAMGFVDDEPFERARVERMLPQVRVYPASACRDLPRLPEFRPNTRSAESRSRRLTYLQAHRREEACARMGLSETEFLSYADMRLVLRKAAFRDLPRIQELLQRTHQLNATGVIHTEGQVRSWLRDPDYACFVAELRDRFVDYGRVGVAACRRRGESWELVSFLLSCRVLSRGVSRFFLAWVERQAAEQGAKRFAAHYRANERNRKMQTLYRLAGLAPERVLEDGTQLLTGSPSRSVRAPKWLVVEEAMA